MDNDSVDLRDQAAVLRRRWRLVAAATAIGLLLGVLLSLIRGPQYEATSVVEVQPVATGSTALPTPILEPAEIATQVQVVSSAPVAERVIRKLRLEQSPGDLTANISVAQVADTRVVRISATNPDAAVAAQIANSFADAYLALRKRTSAAQVAAARARVQQQLLDARRRLRTVDERMRRAEMATQQLPGVRAQLATTKQRLAEVRRQIEDLSATRDRLIKAKRSLGESPGDQQELERLDQRLDQVDEELSAAQRAARRLVDTRQRLLADEQRFAAAQSVSDRLQDARQALLAEITQLNTAAATIPDVTAYTGGQVLEYAPTPTQPTAPLWRNAALGALLGLLAGLGLAFVRDRVDDAVRDEDRLREVLGDVPVLSRIPHYIALPSDRPITIAEPHAPASESFRSLSTSVRFLLAASRNQGGTTARGQVWLVTSAGQGEGKTAVATNLAVAAARFGLRVLLVEADLRRPVIASRFGLGSPPGLSDILANGADAATALMDVGVQNLRVLAGGSVPPNPAELLASCATRRLLRQMTTMADIVILDTPPISGVADTSELLPYADHVLLVTRRLVTRINVLEDALERIHQIGGTVAGTVFNDVDARTAEETYGYGVLRLQQRGALRQRWSRTGDDPAPVPDNVVVTEGTAATGATAATDDLPATDAAAATDNAAPVEVHGASAAVEARPHEEQPRQTAGLRWRPGRGRTPE